MKNLNAKQIAQVKEIDVWTNTNFHGNRKFVGSLPVEFLKEIVAKKNKRSANKPAHYTLDYSKNETQIQKVKRLLRWSLECKGTGYFKTLIEGNTGIYYASPVFGHRDYNKSRVFDKNAQTLKLMQLFNSIVNK